MEGKSGFKQKLGLIYDGWKNLIFPSPYIEKVAYSRAPICASCPAMEANICSDCGCLIAAKVRSPGASCPRGKWKPVPKEPK